MSKIDTLISLINYQKKHVDANKSQIAQGVGITPRYLGRCLGEIKVLKEHLAPSLDAIQIRFLLSKLDQGDPFQREIHQQLQEYLSLPPYTGALGIAHANEKSPVGELSIGEFIPSNNRPSDYLHPIIQFSLNRLCYDSLFSISRNGEIEWRLATAIEPSEDFLTWRITLRTGLRWSDGKPIIREDIVQALSGGSFLSLIKEIKTDGKNQIHIRLERAEAPFPQRLANLPIRPSHSHQPYQVTSGAYRLKRFRPEAINFRLNRNPDYYQKRKGNIDWLLIKRFKHAPRAITAVLKEKIDLIPLDALHPLYQTSNNLPLQQTPFFEEAYYLLILNRQQGMLMDKTKCQRLKEAIDYRQINRYLHAEQQTDTNKMKGQSCSSFNLKIIYSRESPTDRYLVNLVGKSVGGLSINPIFLEKDAPHNIKKETDVLLSRFFFGTDYSRLSQYFHSQGRYNTFSYTNPLVDDLLVQLDETTDVARRRAIGQKIVSILQEDYAIILLSPHFQYLLSPLEIQFDNELTNYADIIENMKHLVIKRQ